MRQTQTLIGIISDKIQRPFNPGNKKVLLFSAFSDTVDYLYSQIAPLMKQRFGIDVAMITGTTDGRTTVKLPRTDMNTILTLFSPLSKDKALLMPNNPAEIDISSPRTASRKAKTSRLRLLHQLRHPLEPRSHYPKIRAH